MSNKKMLFGLGSLLIAFAAHGHDKPVDSYGCHANVAHGTYHCHKGPLAGRQYASSAAMLHALKEQEQTKRPKPKLQPTRF